MHAILGYIYWDPSSIAFILPYFHHPVRWYGILFAAGFAISYILLLRQFREVGLDRQSSTRLTDRLTWYVVIATVIGARLGHVLFYEFDTYWNDPIAIFKTWEGGLASHGGTIAIFVALILFFRSLKKELPGITFFEFLDLFCVVVPPACVFIRLGNFINQEIIGTPTNLPWAIVFGHPIDGLRGVPSHPVQLYEALSYLATYFILRYMWVHHRKTLKPGVIIGTLFVLIFGSRFIFEYIKQPQGGSFDFLGLQMGQILSIPLILFGLACIMATPKMGVHLPQDHRQ